MVDTVVVLGLKVKPNVVTINGQKTTNYKFEENIEKLTINGLTLTLNDKKHLINWS